VAPPPGITPPPPVIQSPPPAPPPPPPPPPPHASVITQPDFTRLPSNDDMAAYFPDRAQRMNVEGRATFRCTVTAGGTLTGCSITSESPADYGFGEATLKLTHLFKMRPMQKDGQPVEGGSFSKTIVWKLGEEE
jgi:protein TonB